MRHTMITVADDDQGLLTTPELAKKLRVSKRTIQRWANEGRITARLTLPNGARRWNFADVERELRERGPER